MGVHPNCRLQSGRCQRELGTTTDYLIPGGFSNAALSERDLWTEPICHISSSI
jgi:hypothetical protein